MSSEQLMNKSEFAARLRVCVRTVDNLIKNNKVRPVKIGAKVFFREHHVTQVLDACDRSLEKPKVKSNGRHQARSRSESE